MIVLTKRWTNGALQTDLAEAQLNSPDKKSPVRVEPELMACTAGTPEHFGYAVLVGRRNLSG